MASIVYFVRRDRDGAIKIGTTQNLRQRLAYLRSWERCAIDLLGVTPGGRARETEIHDALAAHALGNEWFSPTDEVLLAARSNGATLPVRCLDTPGAQLRAWRLRADLTLTALAKRLGVAAANVVYEWEDGTRRPRVHNAIALERATDGAIPCTAWGFPTLAELTEPSAL